jgi:hypothetical protein
METAYLAVGQVEVDASVVDVIPRAVNKGKQQRSEYEKTIKPTSGGGKISHGQVSEPPASPRSTTPHQNVYQQQQPYNDRPFRAGPASMQQRSEHERPMKPTSGGGKVIHGQVLKSSASLRSTTPYHNVHQHQQPYNDRAFRSGPASMQQHSPSFTKQAGGRPITGNAAPFSQQQVSLAPARTFNESYSASQSTRQPSAIPRQSFIAPMQSPAKFLELALKNGTAKFPFPKDLIVAIGDLEPTAWNSFFVCDKSTGLPPFTALFTHANTKEVFMGQNGRFVKAWETTINGESPIIGMVSVLILD